MRIAPILMLVAAFSLAVDADARGRGGRSKSHSSSSSSSYSTYKPKGKPCGNSYIAANKTCHTGSSSLATTAAVGAAGVGAAGLAGSALADDSYYVSVPTLNVRNESSTKGSIVKQLKKGDQVKAYQSTDGWVRISPDSAPVEWVSHSSLSRTKP